MKRKKLWKKRKEGVSAVARANTATTINAIATDASLIVPAITGIDLAIADTTKDIQRREEKRGDIGVGLPQRKERDLRGRKKKRRNARIKKEEDLPGKMLLLL